VIAAQSGTQRIVETLGWGSDARWFRAPGRVNLMGDHTDYNDGFVLPAVIDLDCVVAARPRDDGIIRLQSLDASEEDRFVEFSADGGSSPADVKPSWGRYIAGVARALAELGRPPTGIDAVVASAVPLGSGLASSAALEVSSALALSAAGGVRADHRALALACRRAEELATGVPCGIMDQLACLEGRQDHALLIDCRSLAVSHVRFPRSLAIVAIHSGMPRKLEDSAYAERRAACEAIAADLGLPALRDANIDQVRDLPLARHVVSENARVLATAKALEKEDAITLSRLFSDSQASLRNDYRVSTPELDTLVDALITCGAAGARITGAGFGGCVVGLAARSLANVVANEAARTYRAQTGLEPTAWVFAPSAAAGPVDPSG
jgi:galactokinase